MTPQSSFMITAAVAPGNEAALRALLGTMNQVLGIADPGNRLVPFGQFPQLHFGRFVILADATQGDLSVYGLKPVEYPTYLAFLGDIDGPEVAFLAQLAERAGEGLRRIFGLCEGFRPEDDLLAWMQAHRTPPAANYGNWRGRTVRQVGEEEQLRQAVSDYIRTNAAELAALSPEAVHHTLRAFVAEERRAGRLTLTPPVPTPWGWRLANLAHLAGLPLLTLVCAPVLLLLLPFLLIALRRREQTDPVIAPRVDPAHAGQLAALENLDVTNAFSAMGSLKPGRFRRLLMRAILAAIDYTARHFFYRGHLGRVQTIHFARWVFLDRRRRVLFASNYDGSLEGYMDDFINKVGFGLNLAFSNGLGYPRTNWLLLDGAKDEQKFKDYLRRHQLPTQVWYRAHPGLTAVDQKRNALIRQGLEKEHMSAAAAREWLQLL